MPAGSAGDPGLHGGIGQGFNGLGGSQTRTNAVAPGAAYQTPSLMGGVAVGKTAPNAVEAAQAQGPDPAFLAAEAQRRQQGAAIGNANPNNAALAGYYMGS